MSLEKRLEQLEAKKEQRRSEVEALKESQIDAVLERLTDEDLDALDEMYTAKEERPAFFEEVRQAGRLTAPLEGREAVRDWLEQVDALPEGMPHPLPPLDAPTYFEAEAASWEAGQPPEGVGLEVWQALSRWNATQCRFVGVLASILLGD